MAKADLYRIFDAQGTLLYVGISWSALDRLRGHSSSAAWFEQASRIEIQKCQSAAEARRAERQAILTENPLFNRAHSPRVKPETRNIPLTDRFCHRVEPAPNKERVYYWDRDQPGLALMVTRTGHKSFVYQCRIKGINHRKTIRYGIGLEVVRDIVKRWIEGIATDTLPSWVAEHRGHRPPADYLLTDPNLHRNNH